MTTLVDEEERKPSRNAGHEGNENFKPIPQLKLLCDEPKKAYCVTCCTLLIFLLLFILSVISFGEDFFPFTQKVPLHLRDLPVRQRADAVEAGKLVASASQAIPEVQLERTVTVDSNNIAFKLELVYFSQDDRSIYELERLQMFREIEKEIFDSEMYQKHCYLDWPQADLDDLNNATETGDYSKVLAANQAQRGVCAKPYSQLSSCVPGMSMLANGQVVPSPGSTCDALQSFPAGLLDCAAVDSVGTSGCSYDKQTLSQAFVLQKLQQYAEVDNPFVNRPVLTFVLNSDTSFGVNGTFVGKSFKTQFSFGLPLPGYANAEDRQEEQRDELGKQIYDAFNKVLWDYNLQSQAELNVKLVYSGYQMQSNYIMELLPQDGARAIGSFFFVWFYMTLMKRSWWLSTMGMGQILLSFPPSYFLYYGVFQQRYFGTFNILCIFIILGIGADDIFVISDTWNQSAAQPAVISGSKWGKMSWTWRRSAGAMAVTSATTIVSFLSTATSSFPGIATFGIFAASLVATNYVAVVTFYPAVISMYDRYFKHQHFCCGTCKLCCRQPVYDDTSAHATAVEVAVGRESDVIHTGHDVSKLGTIERFMYNYYAPFVNAMRWPLVTLFVLVVCGFASQALQIESDPEPPQFLPAGDNYQDFVPLLSDNFNRGGSVESLVLKIAQGFDFENPIDRTGTNPSDEEDYGIPVFKEVAEDNFMYAAPCTIKLCDKLETADELLALGGAPEFLSDCWARAVYEYCLATFDQTYWDAASGPGGDLTMWNELLVSFLQSDPSVYDAYKPFLFGSTNTDRTEFKARFSLIQVKLTVKYTGELEAGLELGRRWEEAINTWYYDDAQGIAECLAIKDSVPGFYFTGQPGGIHFYHVQDVMVREAFSGIAFSMFAAYVILCMFSHNWLMSLLSTVVISCIVTSVIGFSVIKGHKLGMIESINFVLVPGLAVDFVAHLSEAYIESSKFHRSERVRDALTDVGISVISGAFSTLGAAAFLLSATIQFFVTFGTFIEATIFLSLTYSLVFFPAIMCCFGPQGDMGDIGKLCHRRRGSSTDHKRNSREKPAFSL